MSNNELIAYALKRFHIICDCSGPEVQFVAGNVTMKFGLYMGHLGGVFIQVSGGGANLGSLLAYAGGALSGHGSRLTGKRMTTVAEAKEGMDTFARMMLRMRNNRPLPVARVQQYA